MLKFKNKWNLTTIPPSAFMESFLIKQCDISHCLHRYGTWNLTCKVKDSLRVFGKRMVGKIIGG
jgi:hypothetical protein